MRPLGETAPPAADRVLLIRLGAMGDVVRTLPSARAIRQLYPGAHLTWLVEAGSEGAVRSAGVVDEVLIFPREELEESLRTGDALRLFRQLREIARQLRRRRFDLALDFHGILKSGILARLSGAPLRYGYAKGVAREGAHLFVNRHVALANPRVSRYERNHQLVRALSPQAPEVCDLRLQPTPLAVARLTARLRVTGRADETGFVLIHPGTSRRAQHKRYPAAAWAEVARQLSRAGLRVWVIAGTSRDERMLVDSILRLAPGDAVAVPESRSFDDLLALLARASVFASSDTGPLHAAGLAGVPVVQVLGPTDPDQNQPWPGTPWKRVHIPLPCSPCRRGCASATCMSVIPPESVARAILELHSETQKPARTGSIHTTRTEHDAAPGST